MIKVDHLIRLLGEARAEAGRLGPSGQDIARQLDAALCGARTLAGRDGKPDEGKRPEQLSSANDG